jgi:hypothetical protein
MLKNKSQITCLSGRQANHKSQTYKLGSLAVVCSLVLGACNVCYAQEQSVYDARGKRNPFTPLVTSDGRLLKLDKEEGTKTLSIEGIIYDEHGLSYAIVNAEVVKIGDEIAGYQVLKIEKNKVIFIKEGQPLEIEFKKEEE